MIKQQDIVNKLNEDFVKLKARVMHLGKEQIFQQSEKITLAKKVKQFLTTLETDNTIYHIFIDMDNIYDVFYKYYKEMQGEDSIECVEIKDVVTEILNNYKY